MSTKILARYHANGIAAQTKPNPFLCPQLMYCPEGTETAIMCPNGKWTAWRGASSSTDCITCSRGKWCNFKDMESDVTFLSWLASHGDFTLQELQDTFVGIPATVAFYYGDCDTGYICLEGATSNQPNTIAADSGYPCPIGHYCVAGATIETPCSPGTYND